MRWREHSFERSQPCRTPCIRYLSALSYATSSESSLSISSNVTSVETAHWSGLARARRRWQGHDPETRPNVQANRISLDESSTATLDYCTALNGVPHSLQMFPAAPVRL